MNNKTKTQLQQREFSVLKDKRRVILKWATGCGKSKMTIDLINYQLRLQRNPENPWIDPANILFVVAERAHIKNWELEFDRWGLLKDRMIKVDVICYASLKNYKSKSYNYIIFDEAHHLFTEKRIAFAQELYDNMGSNSRIYLLSATLSSSKVFMAETLFGSKFTISTITLKDAIKSDILPDPKVYVVAMELDDKKANQMIAARKGNNAMIVDWEHRNKFKFKNTPYTIQCTQKQKNLWFTTEMEYWKQRYELSRNSFHHNYWVNLGSQRKRFLGELKTNIIKKLISNLPKNNRFVCFCASVDQANSLDYVNTISSRRPAKSNQMIIDKFNSKEINHIYAVGMITEGMNLTDIQTGIIVQLDGKERLFIQKFGRSLRAEDPVTFIFYFKDTQDEVYLRNALENIDSKFVKHIDINHLNSIKL